MKPSTPQREAPSAGDAGDSPADGPAATTLVPAKTRTTRLLSYRRLWSLTLIVYILDQLTKAWITQHLPLDSYGRQGIEIIPGFFNLVHVGNTGAAWSMFTGQGTFLGLLAIATLLGIYLWRHQLGLRAAATQFCFGLLCGGILGNLTDRLAYGHVIDFVDLHFGNYIYPTFNVADAGICIGVFGYIIWSLKQPAGPAEK